MVVNDGDEIMARDGAEGLGQNMIIDELRCHARESGFHPQSNVESEGY